MAPKVAAGCIVTAPGKEGMNGHKTFPTYFRPEVKAVLVNAARWIGARMVSIEIIKPD